LVFGLWFLVFGFVRRANGSRVTYARSSCRTGWGVRRELRPATRVGGNCRRATRIVAPMRVCAVWPARVDLRGAPVLARVTKRFWPRTSPCWLSLRGGSAGSTICSRARYHRRVATGVIAIGWPFH
jgi:hypothetical protein